MEQAYRNYWTVTSTFDQRYPESQWKSVLAGVAVDPELSFLLSSTHIQHQNGITLYGEPVAHPTVRPINGATTATVNDCQDASHTGQADLRTGQHKTVGVAKNPVTATLRRGSDGRWRVARIHFPGGSCT